MTSIALYSAPFNLETPFRVLISSESAGNRGYTNVSERIDKLVEELRVQVHSHLEAFNEGRDFIPTSGQWVLFCLRRRTIIPSQNVNNLCTVLTPTKPTNVGEFIILPISKTYVSSETLLERLSKTFPTQIKHLTYSKYLASIPRCFFCIFVSKGARCTDCVERTKSVYHINQVTCPPWVAATAKRYTHLGLWIPRIAAPCDLVLQVDEDPIREVSKVLSSLKPSGTLPVTHSSLTQYTHPWEDYPTEETWILLEFTNKKLLHKDDFRKLLTQCKPELPGQSKTYAVIPVYCGPMASAILNTVQKQGSVGWEEFWQGRLSGSVSGDDDIYTPGTVSPDG